MPLTLIEIGHCNVDLKPSPIEPSWIVERYVKKIAFFRQTLLFGLGYAVRAINKLKRMFFVPGGHPSAPRRDLPHSMILWASLLATTFRSLAKHTT
jgi:hypothetical protein